MKEMYEKWMRMALGEAIAAMNAAELPIGGMLIGGNEVIAKTQTSVVREESIVAHGELMALLRAKNSIWAASRPLTLVTTLEPCLMCLGAAMQCGVDRVVFGMHCAPDGGLALVPQLEAIGQKAPEIVGPVLEDECVEVFARWPQSAGHPAFGYVNAILLRYGIELQKR